MKERRRQMILDNRLAPDDFEHPGELSNTIAEISNGAGNRKKKVISLLKRKRDEKL